MQTCPFLRLPQELLDKIAEAVATQSEPICIYHRSPDSRLVYSIGYKENINLVGLGLTCRRLSTSVQWIYRNNIFRFHYTSDDTFRKFCHQIGPISVNQIASIELLYFPTDEVWNVLWGFSNLRSFRLYLHSRDIVLTADTLLKKAESMCQHWKLLASLCLGGTTVFTDEGPRCHLVHPIVRLQDYVKVQNPKIVVRCYNDFRSWLESSKDHSRMLVS